MVPLRIDIIEVSRNLDFVALPIVVGNDSKVRYVFLPYLSLFSKSNKLANRSYSYFYPSSLLEPHLDILLLSTSCHQTFYNHSVR